MFPECNALFFVDRQTFVIIKQFGNFDYYCIAERGNRIIRRLSERYAELGQVGFIGTQRVDAKLVDPEAVKTLQIK